jgi:glycosyltransferase involved in cell wall biosynthesis
MKIAVCLPSFNEAQNIRNITQVIDSGLTALSVQYPQAQLEIVNFDNNSSDGTSNIFLETETQNSKQSFIIDGVGKGRNILEFCKYAVNNSIDYCLTIDSDITSANPDWIIKLINPLVNKDANYVAPVYERSRFEGSSTNHFAFPLIYAITGYSVRQPIAGDFSFTRSIAKAILENKLAKNELIQEYGIDIFMTLTVIGIGEKIIQVDLGRKIHSPSFNKLEYMFPQVATAALISLSSIKLTRSNHQESNIKNNIKPDSNLQFLHKEYALKMMQNALNELQEVGSFDWADAKLTKSFIDVISENNIYEEKISDIWTSLLTKWISHFLKSNLTPNLARKAGKELLPFFVLRATTFWIWSETREASDVEIAIQKQAEVLKTKVSII